MLWGVRPEARGLGGIRRSQNMYQYYFFFFFGGGGGLGSLLYFSIIGPQALFEVLRLL